jgi:alpha-galactosidase
MILLLLLLHLLLHPTTALDNGLGRVPAMGYNSWYDLMGSLTETNLRQTVDAMVELNLPSLGYNYFNLDDDWAIARDSNGVLIADPSRFTGGSLRSLADYVHSHNMKFGTYTDRGNLTCGGRPAALGHEMLDAKTYADWGVDYLKEDSCNAPSDHATAFAEYGKMRDALNATGRPILFSLCGWNTWYAPEGMSLGNSWRIGPDDTNWSGVLTNIDMNAGLSKYAGPGGFNDPCLLLAEDYAGRQRITEQQTRFQFSMWAIMASPLLISGNIRNMSSMNIATYTNSEIIAVNQDVLGKQGTRVVGSSMSSPGATNVWSKELSNGDVAIAFANTKSTPEDITCDVKCFEKIFSEATATAASKTVPSELCAKDLWSGVKSTVEMSVGFVAHAVSQDGGIVLVRVAKGTC